MKRWLMLFALVPNCTGCLAYAYPTLAYTPAMTVPSGVQAYRIDVDRTERTAAPTTTSYTLSKITVDERGNLPSQVELAHATGIYDPLKVASGTEHEKNKYTMLVRLYRPGYRTIEVQAWDKNRDLNWVKVKNLNEEEKAVDDLLQDPVRPDELFLANGRFAPGVQATTRTGTWWEHKDEKTSPLGLQSGRSSSNAHRDALRFAASEYDRLASRTTPDVSTRDRMRQKATWLRAFADADAVASANAGNATTPNTDLPNFRPMNAPPPPAWQPR